MRIGATAETVRAPIVLGKLLKKPESLSMNARIAVGILFVVLASKIYTLAEAEDVEQVSVVSARQTDPREYVVPVANAQEEPAANLAPELQGFDSPSITEYQDDGFDGCFRPFRNDPCPCVYFQAGALLVQQIPRFSNQPIVVDDNTNTTCCRSRISIPALIRVCRPRWECVFTMAGQWNSIISASLEAALRRSP